MSPILPDVIPTKESLFWKEISRPSGVRVRDKAVRHLPLPLAVMLNAREESPGEAGPRRRGHRS